MKEILLIDKPKGISSFDVIRILRKKLKIKKMGHAGTLDPLATGLLIIGVGKGTKKLSQFLKLDKEYVAKIKLGAVSDTYDKEGKIKEIKIEKVPEKIKVEKVVESFVGEISQTPPLYSAKKIKGKRAYQLARRGIEVKLKPKKVKIYKIEILDYKFPYLKIKVNCSSGTYIRSLAADIGKKLKCGGYLEELKRTKIGKFSLKDAKKLNEI